MLRNKINGTTLRGTDGIDRTLNAVTLSKDEKEKVGELNFLPNDVLLADGVKAVAANNKAAVTKSDIEALYDRINDKLLYKADLINGNVPKEQLYTVIDLIDEYFKTGGPPSKLAIRFDDGGTVTINGKDHVVNGNELFTTFENATSISISGDIIYIDVSLFDTSKLSVFDVSDATNYCTSIDVSKWNTSNMTDMSHLFENSVATIIEVGGWNTSNVTDMSHMFAECYYINALSLSGFDVSNVTNISSMFSGCENLKAIQEVGNWHTLNIEYANNAFANCTSLKNVRLERWDLSNLKEADNMFGGSAISDMCIYSNTQNLYTCVDMFCDCEQLGYVEIDRLNVSNCSDLSRMFYNCKNLQELDISHWNTSNIVSIHDMFNGCVSLETLNLLNWNTASIDDTGGAFDECVNIKTFNFGESFGRALDLEEFDFSYMKNWVDGSVKTSLLSLYDRKTNGLKNLTLKLSPETANALGEDGKTTLESRGYTIQTVSHN